MPPENSIVPLPSLQDTLVPAVEAAKNFETLGITGVLFLMLIIVSGMLWYKNRDTSTLERLTNEVHDQVNLSKNMLESMERVNSLNVDKIGERLEEIKDAIHKLEMAINNLEGQ
mgnify:CR=1 FL=1